MLNVKDLHEKIVKDAYNYEFKEGTFDTVPETDEYYLEVWKEKHHSRGAFYHYLSCMARHLKPKAIVEIGADKGCSALAFNSEQPKDGKVYSCDTREDGWEYVPKTNKRIIKVIGNSLDVKWPIDLQGAKLWLIDGGHCDTQVIKEITRYQPFWKDAVIIFDDVKDYPGAWEKVPGDKYLDEAFRSRWLGVACV